MAPLGAQGLLAAWEQAEGLHPLRRALVLLAAAWPEVEAAHWRRLPIGARDEYLFALHEALFGRRLEVVADCPRCGERLELALDSAAIRVPRPAAADTAFWFESAGGRLRCRLPDSDDLLAVADAAGDDADAAMARLIGRCVEADGGERRPVPPGGLPVAARQAIESAMEELDPGGDLRLAMQCPSCAHAFERRFDIGEHLWDAVDDWAEATLAQVHVLAGAYGWTEGEVLALGAVRRRRYLEMVRG